VSWLEQAGDGELRTAGLACGPYALAMLVEVGGVDAEGRYELELRAPLTRFTPPARPVEEGAPAVP
jgi:hypothetical protein